MDGAFASVGGKGGEMGGGSVLYDRSPISVCVARRCREDISLLHTLRALQAGAPRG